MKNFFKILPPAIIKTAECMNSPLYIVGGFVRNYLIDNTVSDDMDICSPLSAKDFSRIAKESGLKVIAEYPRTGTVVVFDGERKYEYTSFREDIYKEGGTHLPLKVAPTDDIVKDARRRDFKCNAVYFDIKGNKFVDPLGGIENISQRILDAVVDGERVFSADGLRILRLARFSAELSFTPTKATLKSAKRYAENILDISPERILTELNAILFSSGKYPFTQSRSVFCGLSVLKETGAFDLVFPEYSALSPEQKERLFLSVDNAPDGIKFPLLFCLIDDADKVQKRLLSLRVSKKTAGETLMLAKSRGFVKLKGESEKRGFVLSHFQDADRISEYLKAYTDLTGVGDSASAEIKRIKERIKTGGTPVNLKELPVSAKDLAGLGYSGKEIGEELKKLLSLAQETDNSPDKNTLMKIAGKDKK